MNRFLPLTLLVAAACTRFPGRPPADSEVVRPDAVTAFEPLYRANCAGCHGENGRGGAAVALADPLYLAIADDATIRRVVKSGVRGTAMPAFAREAGGMLTQQQVDAIVAGMRERWARPEAVRGNLPGRAMSSDEVSDVVAWLSAQRTQVAGQPYPAAAQAGNEGGGQ